MITLRFPGSRWPSIQVEPGGALSSHLTALNSPVLFGCRTGLCGTCLVTVEPTDGAASPDDDERELLDLLAPDDPTARLACQLRLTTDAALRPREAD
jgi:ferredoxin